MNGGGDRHGDGGDQELLEVVPQESSYARRSASDSATSVKKLSSPGGKPPRRQVQQGRGGDQASPFVAGNADQASYGTKLVRSLHYRAEQGAETVSKLCGNPGPCLVATGGLLFLMLCSLVILLGYVQPRCFSDILPCSIDEKGECLCVVRGNDGSCWKRLESAMKCFKVTQHIPSGICQGYYMSAYCAESQEQADAAVGKVADAFSFLHPNVDGACNLSFIDEGLRCSLPQTRHDSRDFNHVDCCRAARQQCVNDLDCCNCGLEAPACKANLRCMVTKDTNNGTVSVSSTVCDDDDDACLSFAYPGCRGLPGSWDSEPSGDCGDPRKIIGYSYGDIDSDQSASCKLDLEPSGPCRSTCASEQETQFRGCPCYDAGASGCQRKMCVSTSEFYADGGILHKLQKLGAKPDKLCFTDNCNQ